MFGERALRVVGDTQGWAVDHVRVRTGRATTIEVLPGATVDGVEIVMTR